MVTNPDRDRAAQILQNPQIMANPGADFDGIEAQVLLHQKEKRLIKVTMNDRVIVETDLCDRDHQGVGDRGPQDRIYLKGPNQQRNYRDMTYEM